jgi:hypothetical protein
MATTGGGGRLAAVFGLALSTLFALAARAAEPEWRFDTSQRPGEERSVATAAFGGSVETFGVEWEFSNGLRRFRSVRTGMAIVIR